MKTFSQRVLEAALLIPKGRVTTYGDISRACGGGTMASRSITSILSKAYDAGYKNIPFHRIVYAGGKVWLDNKHRAERLALYKKEGIEVESLNPARRGRANRSAATVLAKTYRIKNFYDVLYEFK